MYFSWISCLIYIICISCCDIRSYPSIIVHMSAIKNKSQGITTQFSTLYMLHIQLRSFLFMICHHILYILSIAFGSSYISCHIMQAHVIMSCPISCFKCVMLMLDLSRHVIIACNLHIFMTLILTMSHEPSIVICIYTFSWFNSEVLTLYPTNTISCILSL